MNDILISIAVLTYNSADYIEETLNSIFAQSYNNLELIVSDDGSSDDTIEKCVRWIKKREGRFANVKILTTPINTGIPANYNRAVKACEGEWIKMIDGDDTLINNCIEKLLLFADSHPEARFIHASVKEYLSDFEEKNFKQVLGSSQSPINRMPTPSLQKEVLLRENTVYSASMFMHRSLFSNYGYFDEKYKGMEDFPFLFNLVCNNVYLFFLDDVVANYRRSATSVQNINNFGGLYMRSSVNYYFDKKYRYYHGIEKLSLEIQNRLRRRILNRIDSKGFVSLGNMSLFFLRVASKIRLIIANAIISKLINNHGMPINENN